MKRKKEEMVKRFENFMKKGKLPNKEELYRQIFPENFLGNLNDSTGFKEEDNFYSDSNDAKDSTNFKETYETQKVGHIDVGTANSKQTLKAEDEEPILSHTTKTHHVTHEQEKEEEEEVEEKKHKEEVQPSNKNFSLDQVMSLVTEKKEELNQNLLNLITTNEVEERKLLENIKEDDSEEEKLDKRKVYELERAKNEEEVKEMKE
jgi:hypothetical protein